HRAVGKAGIVLVAEGNPNRLKGLVAAEKKKMARVVADVPVHDVIVGDGEGQVPLKKLRATLLKLPRVLPGAQVTTVNDRLRVRASSWWSPRPSWSQFSAAPASASSGVRSTARGSFRRPPSTAMSRMPSSRLPGVQPTVPTVSTLSTTKTPSAQL